MKELRVIRDIGHRRSKGSSFGFVLTLALWGLFAAIQYFS